MRRERADHQAALHEKRRSLIPVAPDRAGDHLGGPHRARQPDRGGQTTLSKALAERKLAAEERKFKLSTSYNVLLYQRDITDAAVRTINAVIDYQLACTE